MRSVAFGKVERPDTHFPARRIATACLPIPVTALCELAHASLDGSVVAWRRLIVAFQRRRRGTGPRVLARGPFQVVRRRFD